MKLDTLGVQAFVAIAKCGNFQKAAETLFLTQTALTRRLQKFEGYLGVRLIERTTRSIALTETGRNFLPQAERLLADLGNALTEIVETGRAERGDVCIACVPTAGVQYLPPIIQEYAARYPNNRIKILDHSSVGVAAAVARREAEFGINLDEIHHGELQSFPILEDQFVLICRDDHQLAGRKRLRWKQLEGFPLIFAGHANSNRPFLDAALHSRNLHLQAFYEVQRSSTAVGLVFEGVAAAVVPKLSIQRGAHPRIRLISLIDPAVYRTLKLVSRKNSKLSPAAQSLYNLIAERAGNRQSGTVRHRKTIQGLSIPRIATTDRMT
jgi:DNA-binding transcriptional LysR family regulator